MLSDEILDKLVERLVKRIEDVNIYALKDIARIIKELRSLRPSDTQKLIQILQYGGSYNKIIDELSKITNINENEIYEIFDEVAKSDYSFAKQFYKYRNKDYIIWNMNTQLKNQVEAMARITAEEYVNLSRTLAFSKVVDNKVVYSDIGKTYQEVIDKGITAIAQGKSTFDEEMKKTIKELSKSGIRSVDWESGTSRRLDTAVRMHLKTGLTNLHNETQKIIGEQINADGVEITVHSNPAPDHAEAQGRQFSNEQFDKLQSTGYAVDNTGKEINLHRELKRTQASSVDFRPISEYNCYHYTFSIVLGVSKPLFSDKQLQDILDKNEKGFEFEGKHYTMYEGTQLQRQIETEIRKTKDTQIMAKQVPGQEDLVQESEKKIDSLLNKYVELSKVSGLPTKMERLKVDGYKQVPIKEISKETPKQNYNVGKYKVLRKEDFNQMQKETDDFYKTLNENEKRAFNKYTMEGYYDINRILTFPDKKDIDLISYRNLDEAKIDIGYIDDVMNKSKIKDDIVVYKGTNSVFYENAINNNGKEFEIPVYFSTSGNESIAQDFEKRLSQKGKYIGHYGAVLEIHVPKGTKGLYLGDTYNENYVNEFEIILNRNLKYRINNYELIKAKQDIPIKNSFGKTKEVEREYLKIIMEVIK